MKVLVLGKGKTGALVLEVAQERIHRSIACGGLSAQMIRKCAEIARRKPGRAGARVPG